MTRSPWGAIQTSEPLMEGLTQVTTSSHGGLLLSGERWTELTATFPYLESWAGVGALEEDCDWAWAALVWPACFSERAVFNAVRTVLMEASGHSSPMPWQWCRDEYLPGSIAWEIYLKVKAEIDGTWECVAYGSTSDVKTPGWGIVLKRGEERLRLDIAAYPKQFYSDAEVAALKGDQNDAH